MAKTKTASKIKGSNIQTLYGSGLNVAPLRAARVARKKNIPHGSTEYYTLVAPAWNGELGYVSLEGGYLCFSASPVVVETHHLESLKELWKRIMDGAVHWHDNNPNFLQCKIIKFNLMLTDVTYSIQDNPSQAIKLNAIAKLTNEEAEILGLKELKAQQIIFSNPNMGVADQQLVKKVEDNMIALTAGNLADDIIKSKYSK